MIFIDHQVPPLPAAILSGLIELSAVKGFYQTTIVHTQQFDSITLHTTKTL